MERHFVPRCFQIRVVPYQKELLMYQIFVVLIISLFMAGCANTKFIGEKASLHNKVSCTLEDNPCRLVWGDKYNISYIVKSENDGSFSVSGKPDITFSSTSSKKYLQFYFLVMDESAVIFSKKVKTRSTKSGFSFDFSLEPNQTLISTTIVDLEFWVRS